MKMALRIIGGLLALVLLVGVCTYAWAARRSSVLLARTITVHAVDFPIPFPLPNSEIARLKISPDSAAHRAQSQAVARGLHLVESQYPCRECHGMGFSGGTMVDAFPGRP